MAPGRCVVLVPVGSYIEPECARGLADLEARGYTVRRLPGSSAIDQARNELANEALADGFDELMWIDSDISFQVDAIDLLRSHDLPMVCGIYAKKNTRALACHLLHETSDVVFGKGGGLIEILYAPTGFLYTRRDLYESIAEQEKLPVCNERFGRAITPYFWPMPVVDGNGYWYLGEDFAFSERARRCGFDVMADTTIRLDHHGRYGYSWEDAGSTKSRYETYNFHVSR